MEAVYQLLREDIPLDEKNRIFLESVRYLRKSEHLVSYHEMLIKISNMAENVIKGLNESGGIIAGEPVRQYVAEYELFLKEQLKYQVFLYGSVNACANVRALLNEDKVHLLGQVDTVDESLEQSDYVIVCEDISDEENRMLNSIRHASIVKYDLIRFFVYGILPECHYMFMTIKERLETDPNQVEGAVLGLSYERMLDYERLERNLVCMAASSHDLFLDYQKLLWLYHEVAEKRNGNIRYCVIGMDFYRLWYDLSLSNYKGRMMSVYHELHCLHHFHNWDQLISKYEEDLKTCREIMVDGFLDVGLFQNVSPKEFEQKRMEIYNPDEAAYQKDVQIIVNHVFNKPYPHTLKENVGILERFFKFSFLHDIKVLVYIPPFPKIFNQHTPEDMKETTWKVLGELQAKYGFGILDFSGNKAFEKKHFSDCAHLNYAGACLATDLLNDHMNEIWSPA